MRPVLAAALLLAAGCDRMVSRGPAPVYASWVAGQTLVYARPGAEASQRLQVRVKSSKPGPDGLTVVRTYSSFTNVTEAAFRLQDGLETLKLEGSKELTVCPRASRTGSPCGRSGASSTTWWEGPGSTSRA